MPNVYPVRLQTASTELLDAWYASILLPLDLLDAEELVPPLTVKIAKKNNSKLKPCVCNYTHMWYILVTGNYVQYLFDGTNT